VLKLLNKLFIELWPKRGLSQQSQNVDQESQYLLQKRESNELEASSKAIQLRMIGKMCCSWTRFILDGAIKDDFILNGQLELEINHGIFNIHENPVTKTGKDFIVGQLLDGTSNLIYTFTILGTKMAK